MNNLTKLHHKGFTLIELMIAVAIMGLLASIAMPLYSDYVTKGRLSEGQRQLSSFALAMEQYFQNNNTYRNGEACGVDVSRFAAQGFTLSCTSSNANSFTVTMSGSDKTDGYEYTLNQSGARATTKFKGETKTGTNCWLLGGSSC